VAVTLELLQFLPHGVNIGLGFHGLDPDRLPDSPVDPPASDSECTDGDRGLVLADLSVTDAHKLFVPLHPSLRLPRGRIGVPVAPRDGLERS
jgi:hypothetical protein